MARMTMDYLGMVRLTKERQRGMVDLAFDFLGQGFSSTSERSVWDCHTQGLASVVLLDRRDPSDGMVRLFVARTEHHHLDHLYGPNGQFVVGIHNHDYDLALVPVVGTLINVEMDLCSEWAASARHIYEHDFTSFLQEGILDAGEPRLRWRRRLGYNPIDPFKAHFMRATDLHTVMCLNHHLPFTAWLTIESPKRTQHNSFIYSPLANLDLSVEGLYRPMPVESAHQLTEEVYRLAREGV